MQIDEEIYTEATSFIPERWYSKPEMIKHPDAFAPFSMGPFNCIGRNRASYPYYFEKPSADILIMIVARMELRTLTTQLLLAYDISFAPGEDGTRLLTKTKDHFTLSLGQLDLVFTPISN